MSDITVYFWISFASLCGILIAILIRPIFFGGEIVIEKDMALGLFVLLIFSIATYIRSKDEDVETIERLEARIEEFERAKKRAAGRMPEVLPPEGSKSDEG